MPENIQFAFATNFSGPFSVATVNNYTNDLFFVADTGNNRVVLCCIPHSEPTVALVVWNAMLSKINSDDLPGATACFSDFTINKYRTAFLQLGLASTKAALNKIGALTLDYASANEIEYYFEKTVADQTITFSVKFVRENGVWKILEF